MIGAGLWLIWPQVSASFISHCVGDLAHLRMWRVLAGTVLLSSSKRIEMFFPKKITSIRPQQNVLEIITGSSSHPRSNAFLELNFDTVQDKISQRGGILKETNFGGRPVHYYDGW